MDGFKLVTKKKSNRKLNNKDGLVTSISHVDKSNCCFKYHEGSVKNRQQEKDDDRYLKEINACRLEIEESEFWGDFKAIFSTGSNGQMTSDFERILSYGIGHFTTNPIARYQFAFLLMLAEFLKVDVYLYDPVWIETERQIIEHFKLHLIQENEECKRKITARTLIFMLHCGKTMYDNLLSANWGLGLRNLVIVGNAFSSYSDRIPLKILRAEAPHISDIIPFSRQVEIKNSFKHKDIFNDTCCISFPSDLLLKAYEDFWLQERESSKIEDDTEIITRDTACEFVT